MWTYSSLSPNLRHFRYKLTPHTLALASRKQSFGYGDHAPPNAPGFGGGGAWRGLELGGGGEAAESWGWQRKPMGLTGLTLPLRRSGEVGGRVPKVRQPLAVRRASAVPARDCWQHGEVHLGGAFFLLLWTRVRGFPLFLSLPGSSDFRA